MFWERDSTPINQNINTIPQKSQKLKKVESTCRESLTPQKTSTYERPFTHEGNYLVSTLSQSCIDGKSIELQCNITVTESKFRNKIITLPG